MLASPKWSIAGSIQQTILVGKFGELTPRFSFAFKDDVLFDVAEGRGIRDTVEKSGLAYRAIGQKAYWLVNASLAWRPENQNLELRLWARNLLQQAYRVQSFDLTGTPPFAPSSTHMGRFVPLAPRSRCGFEFSSRG